MSMETWNEYGYGIKGGVIGKKYADFMKKTAETLPADSIVFKRLTSDREGNWSKEKFLSELSDIIKDATDEETGEFDDSAFGEEINDRFDFRPLVFLDIYLNEKYDCLGFTAMAVDEYDDTALLYEPLYPWQGKDGDRTMTQKKIDRIFTETAKAIGWENCEPGEQTMYYYG